MKIIFISNAMTPHQKPLGDAFIGMNDVDFTFIEMKDVDRRTLPIGWRSDNIDDYVVPYYEFQKHRDDYQQQILDADAVVLGGDYTDIVKTRLNEGKLTFVYSERIYKSGRDKIKMPVHYLKFRHRYRYKNLYLLCASAFACKDYNRIGCFNGKAYKWGYFVNAPSIDPDQIVRRRKRSTSIKIMWISRLIAWKHPELPVYIAQRLKAKNINFEINMYGQGPLTDSIKNLIKTTDTSDRVNLRGELPNKELLKEIRNHDILLFTSDRNEGWGVVANEAMANACALIGSSAIGSIPYLVENNRNGLIYEDGNIASLEDCVLQLIDDRNKRESISLAAYNYVSTQWSPQNAAANFVGLVNHLNYNQPFDVSAGPCSKAESISDNWFRHYK